MADYDRMSGEGQKAFNQFRHDFKEAIQELEKVEKDFSEEEQLFKKLENLVSKFKSQLREYEVNDNTRYELDERGIKELGEAHELADKLEEKLQQNYQVISDLQTHLEREVQQLRADENK